MTAINSSSANRPFGSTLFSPRENREVLSIDVHSAVRQTWLAAANRPEEDHSWTRTALLLRAAARGNEQLVQILKSQLRPVTPQEAGQLLIWAAAWGFGEIVQILLQTRGFFHVSCAVAANCTKDVAELIGHAAPQIDPLIFSQALAEAVRNRRANTVLLLIAHCNTLSISEIRQAFSLAAVNNDLATMEILFKRECRQECDLGFYLMAAAAANASSFVDYFCREWIHRASDDTILKALETARRTGNDRIYQTVFYARSAGLNNGIVQ